MQNAKCKIKNEGISFGNDLNSSPLATPSFCILTFTFCIYPQRLWNVERKTVENFLKICQKTALWKLSELIHNPCG